MSTTDDKYERKLHVAVNLSESAKADSNRGLIYSPMEIYTQGNLFDQSVYEFFFKIGNEFKIVPLQTFHSPAGLVGRLKKDFGIHTDGGSEYIASFQSTLNQAKKTIEGIRDNFRDYHHLVSLRKPAEFPQAD